MPWGLGYTWVSPEICSLLPGAWGTNQPGLLLITQFLPGFLQTTHTVWVQATNLCEDIQGYDHLWENIPLPFRIKGWQPMFSAIPWALFLPYPYSEARALWVLNSCRLGKSEFHVRPPILDRPGGLPIWSFFCLSPMARPTNSQVHLIWQKATRGHSTSLTPTFI